MTSSRSENPVFELQLFLTADSISRLLYEERKLTSEDVFDRKPISYNEDRRKFNE